MTVTLALFGVYSVSSVSQAYPVSKYPTSSVSNNIDSIKVTRSAREVPVSRSAEEPLSPFAPGTHNLSLGVGQVFLIGDLGNAYQNSLGLQATYNYGVSDLFAFQGDLGINSHSNGDFSVWHASAGLRTNLVYFDRLVPFFNVGLGFYHPSFTYANRSTASALLFGMQLGTGLDLLLSDRIYFGTSLTYHDMFSSTQTASDKTSHDLGGSFISFLIHVGFSFN